MDLVSEKGCYSMDRNNENRCLFFSSILCDILNLFSAQFIDCVGIRNYIVMESVELNKCSGMVLQSFIVCIDARHIRASRSLVCHMSTSMCPRLSNLGN